MVNLKSQFRPMIIAKPGTKFDTFNGEVRKEFSCFPWWNHWPVARVSSDGRYAMAPDQAAHSSLSWVTQKEGAFLYGMTDKPAVGLLPMAKSWIHPAALRIIGTAFSSDGYNQDQRAYLLKRVQTGDSLEIELAGSPESPVFNLPLVIEGWGDREVAAKLNGTDVPRGANFRYGHRRTLDGTDLIVWVKAQAEKPVKLSLLAVK